MIQPRTIVNIADNSGAKLGRIFKVLGATRKRYAEIGDVVGVRTKVRRENLISPPAINVPIGAGIVIEPDEIGTVVAEIAIAATGGIQGASRRAAGAEIVARTARHGNPVRAVAELHNAIGRVVCLLARDAGRAAASGMGDRWCDKHSYESQSG